MKYSESIEDFFDLIIGYINVVVDFFTNSDLSELFLYLWRCIPEVVRIIIIITILLFVFIGFFKAFKS